MNLFYIPVPTDFTSHNSHYKNSILSCLTYEREPLSKKIHIDDLTGLWGFSAGEKNDFWSKKIKIGDVIFFRINTHIDNKKYQAFDGFGFVSDKLSDYSIAKKVWGEDAYGEHLLVIDRYYRFYKPFILSANYINVASIDGIPEETWHRGYNSFKEWKMSEDTASRLVDYFIDEDLSVNLYVNNENSLVERNYTDVEFQGDAYQETETPAMRNERRGQGRFRDDLLAQNTECEICGINDKNLLIASHIKSWKFSDNMERLDMNNGLALCSIHDKLFDKGLISFSNDGKIKISSDLSKRNKDIIGLSSNIEIPLNARKKQYMEWHRKKHGYEED